MKKKTGNTSWTDSLTDALKAEYIDKHPGPEWKTREEISNELSKVTGRPFTDYHMKRYIKAMKKEDRLEMQFIALPDSRGNRNKICYYRIRK